MRNPIIVALIVAVACAEADRTDQTERGDTATATATATPAATPPASAARVQVTVTDSAITVSHDSISTGQITVAVENRGTGTHEFVIDGGEKGKLNSTPIRPGESVLMSMMMSSGTYQLLWPATGKQLKAQITAR